MIVAERKEAQNGDLVLALIDRKATTLRGYRRQGRRVHLRSATPAPLATTLDAARVKVQGIVVGVMRTY